VSSSRHQLRCYSVLPYPKKGAGSSQEDEQLRDLVYAVKGTKRWPHGDPYAFVAKQAKAADPALARDRVLVPLPTHAPLPTTRPALNLARALHARGLGSAVEVAVIRRYEVKSSKHAKSKGERTSVEEHIDSMNVTLTNLPPGSRITLVDDVRTIGTQLMAGMIALQRAGLQTDDIMAVAAGYTVGEQDGRAWHNEVHIVWDEGDQHPRPFDRFALAMLRAAEKRK
jgi:predicted amidophosphoribosyltransferase